MNSHDNAQTQAQSSDLIHLCRAEDVTEGCPVGAAPKGLPALAVYRVGSEYYVTDNLCTHGNALLTEGFQEGAMIECPFHGGAFDISSGKALAFPCQVPLKTYDVILDDGFIAIRVAG